jgi:hypothetical protein
MAAKPEWGTKHQCPKCGTRFYDLGKDDPVHCINCGHDWVPEPILKSKQPLPYDAPKIKEVAVDAEADDDLDIDEDDVVVDSDDVSLDDDDADLAEVAAPTDEDDR